MDELRTQKLFFDSTEQWRLFEAQLVERYKDLDVWVRGSDPEIWNGAASGIFWVIESVDEVEKWASQGKLKNEKVSVVLSLSLKTDPTPIFESLRMHQQFVQLRAISVRRELEDSEAEKEWKRIWILGKDRLPAAFEPGSAMGDYQVIGVQEVAAPDIHTFSTQRLERMSEVLLDTKLWVTPQDRLALPVTPASSEVKSNQWIWDRNEVREWKVSFSFSGLNEPLDSLLPQGLRVSKEISQQQASARSSVHFPAGTQPTWVLFPFRESWINEVKEIALLKEGKIHSHWAIPSKHPEK
jgi:hypothetical protein